MSFEEQVESKLRQLVNTGPSIQSTSAWVLFHKRRLGEVAAIWARHTEEEDEFGRQLLLLYLANDVMQQGLRKNLSEPVAAFAPHLADAVAAAAAAAPGPEELRRLRRVVGVWRDRAVLPSPLQQHIEALLPPEPPGAAPPASQPSGTGAAVGGGGGNAVRLPVLPSGLLAAWTAAEEAKKNGASPAAVEAQRNLADALFREAQLAVQELDRLDREVRVEQQKRKQVERPRAVIVEDLQRQPKRLHEESMAVLAQLSNFPW